MCIYIYICAHLSYHTTSQLSFGASFGYASPGHCLYYILYYVILYYIMSYYIILYYIILYCIVLYYIILYCSILCYIMLAALTPVV